MNIFPVFSSIFQKNNNLKFKPKSVKYFDTLKQNNKIHKTDFICFASTKYELSQGVQRLAWMKLRDFCGTFSGVDVLWRAQLCTFYVISGSLQFLTPWIWNFGRFNIKNSLMLNQNKIVYSS